MPVLCIILENKERRIPFTPGLSVREILDTMDIRMRSTCGGVGTCGLCLVHIEKGAVNNPTANEQTRLSADQLEQKIRLACQVKPLQNMRLTIKNPALKSTWKSLPEDEYNPAVLLTRPAPALKQDGVAYGVAVDLGTTQIRISLCDIKKGQRLAGRSGLNPQAYFGSDVLLRLMTAVESGERAREISRLTRDAIGEALEDIFSREFRNNTRAIGQMLVVGNTAMLALLTGKNYDLLLQPEYWTREIDCRPEDTRPWCISWGLDAGTLIEVAQPLAGFVGSDLLAGVIATQLTGGPAGTLLIDFGTNSEIALWDGARLWVASAAGGPAFEGCGISCGMPAEPGAICRIELKDPSPEFLFDVIGGGEAKGLCGSGLVDIIACLIKAGILNSKGKFTHNIDDKGYVILKGQEEIILKKHDVDVFQRAKAATGAGIKYLLKKAGMHFKDLQRICVCGAFGRFLNVTNAQDIGLLPGILAPNVELCGNTALAGCEFLLFSRDSAGILESLKRKVRIVNLSQIPEFEDLFIENLYLQPMRME